MLSGVLASLFGLPGVAIAQVNDAPSLAGVIDLHAHVAPETARGQSPACFSELI
jgi:hypothetical protein